MSKIIRNIILAIFIIGSFSATEPSCFNLISTKVYAEEKPCIKSIYLSQGDNLDFSKDTYSYIVDVNEEDDEIFVRAKPEDPDDIVKINDKKVTEDDKYKTNLTLDKGKNVIKIEVQDHMSENKTIYTVYVYRGGKKAVYLNDIKLNGSTIGFNKTDTFYNVELDEGEEKVKLEAVPEDGNYSISVNGTVLNETNSKKLKLKGIGKYPPITIDVKDNDTKREGTYTLNIYLGIPVTPNVSGAINAVLKPNQWVMVNGRWKYNDALGESLKDTWFYDNKYESYFHFTASGNMQTGWINDGGNYYYLSTDGKMQTGWFTDQDNWYYLDYNGAMRTGWVNLNDKWYYLNKDGTMAKDWIITNDNWHYLNENGVMQTGWLHYNKKWYYLNSDGIMQRGWIQYQDNWYYLNTDGSMKAGEWFKYSDNWYYINYDGTMRHARWLYNDKTDKGYYLNEDGTMRTTPIIIDGYECKFNDDGSVIYE